MSAISTDYQNIILTDDGADFSSAVKDEIQAIGVDLALRPVNTGTETISGAWTHSANITLDNGGTNSPNLEFKDTVGNHSMSLDISGSIFRYTATYNGGAAFNPVLLYLDTKIFRVEKLRINNISTTSIGLSSGDVWSNSGVLTIVA